MFIQKRGELKMVKNSNYLKFIDEASELVKSIPRYFSKFSNKIYCNHQLVLLLVLKQKLKTTYRGLIEILEVAETLRLAIGLKRIPHHTTLVKFAKKISKNLLRLLFPSKIATNVAIDYSGFELEAKSYYYRKRFFMFSKRKNFMRTCLLVDTDKQLILDSVTNHKQGTDNTEFLKLLKDAKVDYVLADKGYDARSNRKFVFDKLGAIPQIPFRKTSGRDGSVNRTASYLFSESIYHQRSKVETVFSVIKRKYGSILKSRTYLAQQKESLLKLITYNIDRLIILYKLLIIGFQQSSK